MVNKTTFRSDVKEIQVVEEEVAHIDTLLEPSIHGLVYLWFAKQVFGLKCVNRVCAIYFGSYVNKNTKLISCESIVILIVCVFYV